jgi:hypothetical protein
MSWFDRSRFARCLLLWGMTACLTIGLPLQSISTAIADISGPRHAHRTVAPATAAPGDPMDGWKDFRHANYALVVTDASLVHAHAHELGLRHHHDRQDASVVDVETASDGNGVPSGTSTAGAHFLAVPAPGVALHRVMTEPVADAWRTAPDSSFRSQYPRRIERPPQARG